MDLDWIPVVAILTLFLVFPCFEESFWYFILYTLRSSLTSNVCNTSLFLSSIAFISILAGRERKNLNGKLL